MKKILVLTDSLGLPRDVPEFCSYESTWPVYLKSKPKAEVHQVSIGGGTSADILRQLSYHQLYNPDIVIIQVGIVDCAPRFMTKFELTVVRKIPLLGTYLIKVMNRKLVRKIRNITYVKPAIFKENLEKIKNFLPKSKFIIIGIIPANNDYEKILPGIGLKIDQYNEILSHIGGDFITLKDLPADSIMSDHIHLKEKGHKYIFDILKEKINA